MEKTFLYVATGINYVEECIASAENLKKIEPETPITVYTDEKCKHILKSSGIFSNIEILQKVYFDFHDKINALILCKYKKVIYMDTDTVVLNQFDLWDILDQFDLAFVYDPIRWDFDLPEIPESFTTPNGGFLALNKKLSVCQMLSSWLQIYFEQLSKNPKPLHDQPALRKAVYESKLRFLVLPDEYNLRVSFPYMVPGNTRVKMLHGRHEKLEMAIQATKRVQYMPRVYGGIYSNRELLNLLQENIYKRLNLTKNKKWTSSVHKV